MKTALALSGVSIIRLTGLHLVARSQHQLIGRRTLPRPQLLFGHLANLGRIEIAHHHQLRVRCAEEIAVEFLDLRQRHFLGVGDVFLERSDRPRVARRIADQMAAQRQRASAPGSFWLLSTRPSEACRNCSNSDSTKAGCRKTSAASRRAGTMLA